MDEPTQDELFLDAVVAVVQAALARIGDDPEPGSRSSSDC
jgi:hypothetical protein